MLTEKMKKLITLGYGIKGQRWGIIAGPDKEITDPDLIEALDKLYELDEKEFLAKQMDILEDKNGKQD